MCQKYSNSGIPEPKVRDPPSSETSSKFSTAMTITRHSGFRGLHKVGRCGVHPWSCHSVEYISKVVEGVADAVCKTCKRVSERAVERVESSSSGSSSSTEMEGNLDQEDPLDEPLGDAS